MRLITILCLALFLGAPAALAQDGSAVYKVADVIVDVTSGNASMARDTAFVQAQKHAFVQLLERLGVGEKAAKANDDAIAALVQAIDIQKEHVSGLRYIGTFTVQFKPEAVRSFLSGRGLSYVEARARPLVVLPILRSKGRDVLWEDTTPWHHAWADEAKNAGLVPMIIPEGDLDDVAKITTSEALSGNPEKIQLMMQKYEADGVLVALLEADLDATDGKVVPHVEVRKFDATGQIQEPSKFDLPPITSASAVADILSNGAKQVMGQAERGWRQSNKAVAGPSNFLPIDVSVPTLAAWTQIRNKMKMVSPVVGAHIVTMTRGLVHAEIEFRGDVPSLQKALGDKGLLLQQGPTGGWELRNGGESY